MCPFVDFFLLRYPRSILLDLYTGHLRNEGGRPLDPGLMIDLTEEQQAVIDRIYEDYLGKVQLAVHDQGACEHIAVLREQKDLQMRRLLTKDQFRIYGFLVAGKGVSVAYEERK